MASPWRTILCSGAIAFAAGALGVYAGLALLASDDGRDRGSLDAIVHRELDLSTEQLRQLEAIEAEYASRKDSLEEEMRQAAREIAEAVFEDKAHTPRVRQAVDRFHTAMGELQHETIEHVFEMRTVLDETQQEAFDQIVRAELLRSAEDGRSR